MAKKYKVVYNQRGKPVGRLRGAHLTIKNYNYYKTRQLFIKRKGKMEDI